MTDEEKFAKVVGHLEELVKSPWTRSIRYIYEDLLEFIAQLDAEEEE